MDIQLAGIKTGTPKAEWNEAQGRYQSLLAVIEHKEDSLVGVNLELLQKAGLDAAIDYMEFTLRRCEVLPEKIARVDAAILATPLAGASPEDEEVSEEMSGLGLDESADNGSLSLAAVQLAVQKRAQARADSLKKIEDAQAKTDEARKKRELATQEREQRKQAKQLAREQRRKDKEAARRQRLAERESKKTKPATHQAATSGITLDSVSAKQKMLEIYTLLESNSIAEAYDMFAASEQALQQNIHYDVFMMLKYTVSDAHASLSQQGEASAGTVPQVVLVEKTVEPAPAPTAAGAASPESNEAIARQKMTYIYKLLEQNDVAGAYDSFQKLRPKLQKYLSADLFEMLQVTVDQSYQDFARPAGQKKPGAGL
jgi:hypothetical protein